MPNNDNYQPGPSVTAPVIDGMVHIPDPLGPYIVPGVALLPVTEKPCAHVMIPGLGPEKKY